MKELIKIELDHLKAEYRYIPATSKFKRSLLYKIANNYGSIKECIIELYGIDEYKNRSEILSKQRKRIKIRDIRSKEEHYQFIKSWTSIFKEIEYIPSNSELSSIHYLNSFNFSVTHLYKSKEKYVKVFNIVDLYNKSSQIQTKNPLNKRVNELEIKLKPFIDNMKNELNDYVNLFKNIGAVPDRKYIQDLNDKEFIKLFIIITSLYYNYDDFISSNKLEAEFENKDNFEKLFKDYREA